MPNRSCGRADDAPRELWVGLPVIQAILGSALIPGLLDRYLGANAYEQQMLDTLALPDHRAILFEPAGTDHGAHGPFDAGARTRAVGLDPALLRSGLAAVGLGAFAAAFFIGRRSSASGRTQALPPARLRGSRADLAERDQTGARVVSPPSSERSKAAKEPATVIISTGSGAIPKASGVTASARGQDRAGRDRPRHGHST